VADALAEAFRSEIPCDAAVASLLATLVREHLPRLGGGPEDTDADVTVRLRDPRFFGSFAETVLEDRRAGPAARDAVLEHVFDLLPLPSSEGELIDVESRAPPRLLGLALRLAESDGLTVLHVMHLVYAVFLDRSLVLNVPRATRSALYRVVLDIGDAGENLLVLYACLHLSAVGDAEAASEFRKTLRSRETRPSFRRALASVAASADGGQATLTRVAQREGLLPSDLGDLQGPAVLANIPRLPEKLAAVARKYLERNPSG
jgi:hypothetical protein